MHRHADSHDRAVSVSLDGAPAPRVIVDFRQTGIAARAVRSAVRLPVRGGRRTDRDGWVAPLELKRGRFHAGEFVRQLQAGATTAEKLVPRECRGWVSANCCCWWRHDEGRVEQIAGEAERGAFS